MKTTPTSFHDAEVRLINLIDTDLAVKQITVGKHVVRYIVAGNGPPLLLLHGLNIGWGNWHANIADLSKHFTVYALDLPGAGGSTKVNFHSADIWKDFFDVVDKFILLHHLKNISIIGHSFSCWIALQIALQKKHTLKKLILVGPVCFSNAISGKQKMIAHTFIANFLAKIVTKPTRKNMKQFLSSAMADSSLLNDEFVDYFHQGVVRDQITHPFHFMNRLLKSFRSTDELTFQNNISHIELPVLFISGEKDSISHYKKNRKHFEKVPNIHFTFFPQTGHVPQIEKSNQFNQTVIEFLSEHF